MKTIIPVLILIILVTLVLAAINNNMLRNKNKALNLKIDSLNKEVIKHHEFLNKQENEIKRLEKENFYLILELKKVKQENEVIKIY
jgi:hypothetical protein